MNAHPTPIEDAFLAAMSAAKKPKLTLEDVSHRHTVNIASSKIADVENYVRDNPGCHPVEVAEAVGLSPNRAKDRLRILFQAGRLARKRESQNTPYRYEVSK